MWISDFAIRRPIITITVMLAIVAFGLAALLITTIATIYPAVAASRLRPVEGIRYE